MRPIILVATALLLLLTSNSNCSAAEASDSAAPDRAKLEEQLAKRLSNARLEGFFMIEGQEGPPTPDEYVLGEVHKGDGDKWVFNAKFKLGQKMVSLPLEIPVQWAGDTPVITATQFQIPGFGTYTARVLIDGEHYAGTWSSPRHGGYLWGRITVDHSQPPPHAPTQQTPPPQATPPQK